MNYKMIFYLLKKITVICAILLFIPFLISLFYTDGNTWAFLIPILGLFAISLLVKTPTPTETTIYAKEGFLIVALSWLIVSLVGALPYYFSGLGLSYLDCLFETVSGLTTTGSSIFTDVEILPQSLLFWRSFTIFIGGMGVLVFLLAILPQTNPHSVHLIRAEMPGHQVGKLVSKVKDTVKILYSIYIALTALLIILLLIGGMPLFDSVVNAFATAGTGGFAIKNTSIAYYDSVYLEIVIGVFMILFGINFSLYYLIVSKEICAALKSEELKWFLLIIVFTAVLIAINISPIYKSFAGGFRHAFFQVSSVITTTGFSTTDFDLWPNFAKALLMGLMFIGAMSGSTGGGLKISRIIIMFKTGLREVKRLVSPRLVSVIKFENQGLKENLVAEVNTYLIVLLFFTAISTLILSLDKIDALTAFSAVATCINNVGPGFSSVGPSANFSSLANLSKGVLIFDMLIGRLELFPILILFSPLTWKRK